MRGHLAYGTGRAAARCALSVLLMLASNRPAVAQDGTTGAATAVRDSFTIPQPVGLVNDFAGLLTAAEESRLHAVLQEVRAKSKGEIAVVTVSSLDGLSAAEVARRIGNRWGVGYTDDRSDPADQTGVVLLVAPREREYRLELASGVARFIPDAEAAAILDEHMVPALRRSAYGDAILDTVRAVAERFAKHFGFALEH